MVVSGNSCHLVMIGTGNGCHMVVEVIGNDCPGSGWLLTFCCAEKKFHWLIHHTKSSGRKFFSRLSKSVAQKTFYMGSSCLFYWPWVWNPQKELISTVKHYYVSNIYRYKFPICSYCCQPVLSVRLLHISIFIWSRFVQDLDLSGKFSLLAFEILQHDLYSLDHYGSQDGWG